MSDWLQDWSEAIPETMGVHANADHDMGDVGDPVDRRDSDMPGIMSADDFDELENARAAEFRTMSREMLVEHDEGAVEMAEHQQENGQYKPAVDLAGKVVDDHSAEIDQMQALLGSAR